MSKVKIAILNDIHLGPPLEYQGYVRASSHLFLDQLPRILKHIVEKHQPHLLINLGDLIRSEEEHIDLQRYTEGIACFQNIDCPVLHMIGNHELKRMTLAQIEEIWKAAGYQQKSYGSMFLDDLQLIWLGLEPRMGEKRKFYYASDEELEWLDHQLSVTIQPTLVFTHCPVDKQDLRGNFFHDTFDQGKPAGAFLENHLLLQQIFNKHSHVKAVFQAHLHQFHTKMIGKVSYITCPAMGDNITGPEAVDHIPEIYTILMIDQHQLSTRVYGRHFCFAGTEVPLSP